MNLGRFGIGALMLAVVAWMPIWAGQGAPRIWILPFDNARDDSSLEHLEEGLPALLTVSVSKSEQQAVVDRRHLNRVLAEQSLTLEDLTAQETRLEVGSLLGVTVIISGSFFRQGQELFVAARATDVETGILTSATEVRGPAGRIGDLVAELYRGVTRDLGRRLPELSDEQIDEAPLSSLRFMRGLGDYYSARYHQALAQFMQAAEEEQRSDIASLWLANTYLALERYDHACLELNQLKARGPGTFQEKEIEAKLQVCSNRLSKEEMSLIRELVGAKGTEPK